MLFNILHYDYFESRLHLFSIVLGRCSHLNLETKMETVYFEEKCNKMNAQWCLDFLLKL